MSERLTDKQLDGLDRWRQAVGTDTPIAMEVESLIAEVRAYRDERWKAGPGDVKPENPPLTDEQIKFYHEFGIAYGRLPEERETCWAVFSLIREVRAIRLHRRREAAAARIQ